MHASQALGGGGEGLPWELRAGPKAYGETICLVLFQTTAAFGRMRLAGELTSALSFAMLTLLLGVVSSALLVALLQGRAFAELFFVTWMTAVAVIILGPPLLFGLAAVCHLSLRSAGGANRDYWATFRTVAFTTGPVSWLAIFALPGVVLALLAQTVLLIVGLARVHETTRTRAAIAVVLPLIVVLIGGMVVSVWFGTAAPPRLPPP